MDNFDDENYDDGFNDDALAARMNVELWKKLFGYAKQYPRDLTYLGGFAFVVASAEVTYPLITKGVVDAVATDGADAVLLPWALGYLLCTVAITLSIGIITSMFTAIMGTRAVINLIYGGQRVRSLSI